MMITFSVIKPIKKLTTYINNTEKSEAKRERFKEEMLSQIVHETRHQKPNHIINNLLRFKNNKMD